jgi:hypothetical protein
MKYARRFPMNVTSMSESEFMCDGHRSVTCGTTASASDIIEAYGLRGRNFPILCDYGQWKVVAVNAADTALIDINGAMVGIYVGDILIIDYPPHYPKELRGLSVPLILFAIKNRKEPSERTLTIAGERALRRAWRVANEQESSRWWPCPSASTA